MKSVSTHVLDIHRGRPAQGVPVKLERKHGEAFELIKHATTDADGRVKDLIPDGQLEPGTYRITFDTSVYFASQDLEGFYPEATVVFLVRDANSHYHVPLLLSAHGFSTYRGS
jgi:5-hydroxyisourate hydrolase